MKEEVETWKPIKGYEGFYEFSNFHNIKSLSRVVKRKNGGFNISKERILKQTFNGGYYKVTLSLNGEVSSFGIHQLIAMEHLGHTVCGYELVVDHINEIKTDNRVENLQIITGIENTIKSITKRKAEGNYRKTIEHKKIKKPKPIIEPQTFSVRRATAMLGTTRIKMNKMLSSGEIKKIMFGKMPRICRAEIDKFLPAPES